MLEYKNASEEFAPQITKLVQGDDCFGISEILSKEVVDFCGLHCEDAVRKDIRNGNIRMLLVEGCLAGTGSREGDHITRVYVSPSFQGKGYGTYIIKKLEEENFSITEFIWMHRFRLVIYMKRWDIKHLIMINGRLKTA